MYLVNDDACRYQWTATYAEHVYSPDPEDYYRHISNQPMKEPSACSVMISWEG